MFTHRLSRWFHLVCLTLFMALPLSMTSAQTHDQDKPADPAQTVAQAYKIGGWDQIERIDFTFMAQSPGRDKPTSHRQWSWWPKQGKVTLTQPGQEPVEIPLVPGSTQMRPTELEAPQVIAAHKKFINDSYWFLFPFQIVWSNPKVTDQGAAALPMGEGEARKDHRAVSR